MPTLSVRAPTEDELSLYRIAEGAMMQAYAPYSRFRVGAALETTRTRREGQGPVTGANVENGSYGLTICAERSAVVRAIAQGACPVAAKRTANALGLPGGELPEDEAHCIEAIAIATPVETETGSPCGACRQVLSEFATPQMMVTMRLEGQVQTVPFAELLPEPFKLRTAEPPPPS